MKEGGRGRERRERDMQLQHNELMHYSAYLIKYIRPWYGMLCYVILYEIIKKTYERGVEKASTVGRDTIEKCTKLPPLETCMCVCVCVRAC